MTSEFAGWGRRRPRWTRKKALALVGGVTVAFLAAFGIYEYLPGTATTPTAATSVRHQDTTVYYSDGKTVLGTFGAVDRPDQAEDPWAPYLMTQVENELTGIDGVSRRELQTGGLRVVTTFSRSMEIQLYKSVDESLDPQSLGSTPGATVTSLPAWVLVGAELQDPKSGQIIAEYPGKGGSGPAYRAVQGGGLRCQHGRLRQGAGRVVVQALRARHRGLSGHERQDQHAGRQPGSVRPAGLQAAGPVHGGAVRRDQDVRSRSPIISRCPTTKAR